MNAMLTVTKKNSQMATARWVILVLAVAGYWDRR
jgi:hypothetical protein